jgi:16S rRNA (uracil1498-N3)-methyltransferase
MRAPRVFVDLPLVSGQRITLPPKTSQHLVQVLRLRAGDRLVLFNGDGRDYSASLVRPSRRDALVEIGIAGDLEPQPSLELHLAIGVSKGERMDFALQKSIELGATGVTPLFTRRSVVRLSEDRLEKRMVHWKGVIQSACEQSGRRRLPELYSATDLDIWLGQPHPCPIVLDHRTSTTLLDIPAPAGKITLLVGPEGGLAETERSVALSAGFRAVRLGPRILRTETAPLAALAAVQMLWGDLRNSA